jgi:pyruvate kinase
MVGIGVDWVALSFVQQPSDIVEINELIDQHLKEDQFRPAVMAKIEKPSCFVDNNLDKIVDLCDGIMVARGDLGKKTLQYKIDVDTCFDNVEPLT